MTLEPPEPTALAVGEPLAATVTVANPQDTVTVTRDGPKLIVDIESPRGIGQAAVELAGPSLPSSIVLRFHLAGLEQLEFAYAGTTITVSLLSSGDRRVLEQVVAPGMSSPTTLTPASAYWMEVVSSAPYLIEVAAPADFFQGEHRSFSMQWIDFYR
jgi:hypothetical protein